MCTVSMVGDDFSKQWPSNPNNPFKDTSWPFDNPQPLKPNVVVIGGVSQEQFDALKKEVEALKELLKAAKIYDEATGQKDCEMDDKVALIKRLAEIVGVDLGDIFS